MSVILEAIEIAAILKYKKRKRGIAVSQEPPYARDTEDLFQSQATRRQFV
jgi:hypothetical protein